MRREESTPVPRPFVMNGAKVLLAASLSAAIWAALPQPAAGHRDGRWLLSAEVQRRVENRGYELAICRGRGPLRLPVPIADPQYAFFRHFECFVNVRGSSVLCVHTRPGARLVLTTRPQEQRRCRF
jgi:hypothetical protein